MSAEPLLQEMLDAAAPKVNPKIGNGYSTLGMKNALQYMDKVFESARNGWIPGFRYEGFTLASPERQLAVMTKERWDKTRPFDLSENYLFLVDYHFSYEYDGVTENMTQSIFLPYSTDANIFKLGGSNYMISPVLADNGISVSLNTVYMGTQRAKMTFKMSSNHFKVNGVTSVATVAYSNFYNKEQKNDEKITLSHPSLVHYLMCRKGIEAALSSFAGTKLVAVMDGENYERFPEKDFVTFSTNATKNLKPKGWKAVFSSSYEPTRLHFVIPRDQYDQSVHDPFFAGVFYILDHFPEKFRAEYFANLGDELWVWKETLGLIHHPQDMTPGARVDQIEIHLSGVDTYVDDVAIKELARDNINVSDTYDLFFEILTRITKIIAEYNPDIGTMYDKRLQVCQYILGGLKNMVFSFMFALQGLSNPTPTNVKKALKDNKKGLRPQEIKNILPGKRGAQGNIENFTYPGDNKIFKITSNLVLQKNATVRKGGSGDIQTNDPENFAHASILECGNYLAAPKSDPTGRSKINPYVVVDEDGFIVRQEKFRALLDQIQDLIRRG